QLGQRDVYRIHDVAALEVLALTDIHDHTVLTVDQQGCLLGAEALGGFGAEIHHERSKQRQPEAGQYPVIDEKFCEAGHAGHSIVVEVPPGGSMALCGSAGVYTSIPPKSVSVTL